MGAGPVAQFWLLLKKNLKIKVVRNPFRFLLEIILPVAFGFLFVWMRGFLTPELMDAFKYPTFEFQRWPGGLDAPYKNPVTNQSEFILFYAPANEQTDLLMESAIGDMNGKWAKWYSMEEYILEEVIYNPIGEVAKREVLTESDFDDMADYAGAFGLSSAFGQSMKNYYLYGDFASCYDEEGELDIEASHICKGDPSLHTASYSDRADWIEDVLIRELKSSTWGHCSRPYLIMSILEIAKYIACNHDPRPDIQGRLFQNFNSIDFEDFEIAENILRNNILNPEQEATLSGEKNCKFSNGKMECTKSEEAIKMSTSRISSNIRRNPNLLARLFPESRSSGNTVPDFSSYCVTNPYNTSETVASFFWYTQLEPLADEIHENVPRVEVVAHGFTNITEMRQWILDEKENGDMIERKLAVVEFDNGYNFTGSADEIMPKDLTYTIRPSPEERNLKESFSDSFESERSQSQGSATEQSESQGSLSTPGSYWATGILKMSLQIILPRLGPHTFELMCGGNLPNYYKEGFAMIQASIDNAFIDNRLNATNGYNLDMSSGQQASTWKYRYARFPFGQFSLDIFPVMLNFFSCLLITLGTLQLVLSCVGSIVEEKELRIKEYMKVMGATNFMQWMSWLVYYTIICGFISVLFCLVYTSSTIVKWSFDLTYEVSSDKCDASGKDGCDWKHYDGNQTAYDEDRELRQAVLPNTEFGCFFITMFLNLMQIVCFSMFCTTWFTSSSNGSAVCGLIHFMASSMWGFISYQYSSVSLQNKIGSCFFPSLTIGHIWQIIASVEGTGQGLTSETIDYKFSQDNDFSMRELWWIMINYCIFYMLITFYIETINPGEFGVPRKWYFPVQLSFWFPEAPLQAEGSDKDKYKHLHCFEEYSSKERNSFKISIKGLRKEFDSLDGKKVAVNDLNLDICHGQITSILGHNGAGKTTLMNMLTGMFAPTRGTATVNGFDICNDIRGVRRSLGLCPQFNIFMNQLTIREHLAFFAGMKGTPLSEIESEVEKTIETLRFQAYANNYPSELSGGWKRRLSVGIALIGNSQCVILDEPTSGMDPSTRRILWSILQEIKHDRTIILSTHFMDEADILGDRIAIMSDGVLQAAGSSPFLKNHFGCGYHILFSSKEDEFSTKQIDGIKSVVQKIVPNMTVERCLGQELNILCPFESVDNFEQLFKTIDSRQQELGVLNYGAMLTSMDEVFLKCTAKAKGSSVNIYNTKEEVAKQFELKHERKTGISLRLGQFIACLKKNFLVIVRDRITMLVQIGLGFGFVFTLIEGMKLSQTMDPVNSPKLALDNSPWYNLYKYNGVIPYWVDKAISSENATVLDNVMTGLTNKWNTLGHHVTAKGSTNNTAEAFEDEIVDTFNTISATQFDTEYMVGVGIHGNVSDFFSYYGEESETVYLHFNGQHYHTAGQAQNLGANALYRYLQARGDNGVDPINDDLGLITTYNHPLPLNQTQVDKINELATGGLGNSGYYYDLGFVMALIVAMYCRHKVNERNSKSKHCQGLTGLPIVSYWLSFYLVDLLFCCLILFVIPLTYYSFGDTLFGWSEDGTFMGGSHWYLWFYLTATAMALLPQFYALQRVFETSSGCIIFLMMVPYMLASFFNLAVNIKMQVNTNLEEKVDVQGHAEFKAIWPHYTFLNMIDRHFANNASRSLCTKSPEFADMCVESNITYTDNWLENSDDGTGEFFALLGYQAIYWFLILFVLEWAEFVIPRGILDALFFRTMIGYMIGICFNDKMAIWFPIILILLALCKSKSPLTQELASLIGGLFGRATAKISTRNDEELHIGGNGQALDGDQDVKSEQDRIQVLDPIHNPDFDPKTEVLLTQDLSKIYQTNKGPLLAVDKMSFGTKPKSCFGLLGINGAGKSTAFKMFTGDERITGGDCWTAGFSLRKQKAKAQTAVGYCPQFDALIDSLTGIETLQFYCDLRGLQKEDAEVSVSELLRVLDLTPHMRKECGIYSGGNKRKLSTALAMVGEPKLLFLDEPSTGMDPGARHALWDAILKMQARGASIILTSHSMEECEALCSRLAIMVNGKFQCIGTVQRLRNLYGRGFTIELSLSVSREDNDGQDLENESKKVNELMEKYFGMYAMALKEDHGDFKVFDIPNTDDEKPVPLYYESVPIR